jgi:type III secretion protein D
MRTLYLHFLNGPLKNQSLLLPKGELRCGQHDECDIHVPLEGKQSEFALSHRDEGVWLIDGIPCQTEGKMVDEGSLPMDSPIEVGGCQFLLSASNTLTLSAPLPALYTQRKTLSLLRRYSHVIVTLVLGGLVLTVGLAYLLISASEKTPQISIQERLTLQPIQALPNMALKWLSPKRVTLSGYYPEESVLRPLLQTLKKNGIRYQLQAFNQQDVLDSVRYLAVRRGYHDLMVSAGEQPGVVDISGAIIADETWRRFLRELKIINGLQRWEVKNLSLMNTSDLLTLVKNLGLLGRVSIERDKQKFTITGLLTEEQKSGLNQGLTRLTGGFQDKILFQNMAPANPSDSIFPNPVVSVGGNKDKPFVELLDGRRLQPGARLENNYEIVAIDTKYGIDLLGEDNLLHYTFNF